MQGSTPDVSSYPTPPAAPIPPELDLKASPEPVEPILKKRKVPRLIAPSDLTAAVKTGGPSMTADADADAVGSGAQPLSSGELLSEPLMLLYTQVCMYVCMFNILGTN